MHHNTYIHSICNISKYAMNDTKHKVIVYIETYKQHTQKNIQFIFIYTYIKYVKF